MHTCNTLFRSLPSPSSCLGQRRDCGYSSYLYPQFFIKPGFDSPYPGPRAFHGQSGTMNVEQPRYQNILHDEFFRAAAAAGLPLNTDFNDWSRPQVGVPLGPLAYNCMAFH